MKAETYEGSANYETWCVSLWLNNDISSYRHWKEEAKRALEKAPGSFRVKEWGETATHAARCLLAEQLSEALFADLHETPDLYTDLLRSALSEVDWFEVADGFLEGATQAAATEAEQGPNDNSVVDQPCAEAEETLKQTSLASGRNK
jgi:hypothetical protein